MTGRRFARLALVTLAGGCAPLVGCAEPEDGVDPRLAEELDIGDRNEPGEQKSDGFDHNGEEDFSEECKPIPDLEPLVDPEITVSIDGRTLHLVDRGGDYDRVFPVGLGKIDESGESLTPTSESAPDGVFFARTDFTQIEDAPTADRRKWAWNYSCRIWSGTKYFNPLSGREEFRSYFAGLPFIRFEGPEPAVYGMHGPIDNYWRESGGELYRGYVSGGCTRMDAEDLLEVAARIAGHKTPVLVQREIEFDENGLAVDSDRFMGAHCLEDSDCADEGALCVRAGEGENFCAMPCETSSDCPVRENDILGSIGVLSYCMADELDLVESEGICLIEGNNKTNHRCASYPAQFEARSMPRLGSGAPATVCAPVLP